MLATRVSNRNFLAYIYIYITFVIINRNIKNNNYQFHHLYLICSQTDNQNFPQKSAYTTYPLLFS